jgi:transcription elongation factor Elf1
MNAKQISAAKTAELVAFYNANCAVVGKKPVSKFADRKTAEKRVAELVASLPKPKTEGAAYRRGTCPKCGNQTDITCGKVVNLKGKQEVVNEHEALCHSCGHEFNYETGKALRKAAATNPGAAKQIAASWKDPEVFAARITRNNVKVDGTVYTSVREAFIKLSLPLGQHIKFRMQLKVAGKLEGFGKKWVVLAA